MVRGFLASSFLFAAIAAGGCGELDFLPPDPFDLARATISAGDMVLLDANASAPDQADLAILPPDQTIEEDGAPRRRPTLLVPPTVRAWTSSART